MVKKAGLLLAGGLLIATTAVWADGSMSQTMPESAPQIMTVNAPSSASIDACRWPVFEQGGSNDNPTCAAKLRSSVISNAPRSGQCPKAYADISEMSKIVPIPEEYRTTAALMVNWVVRVEGVASPVNPWTEKDSSGKRLCHPWHGTSVESFPGGKVSTRLLVNQTPLGLSADMTLPSAGIVTVTNKSDPTISGSYVIKPSDFGGILPAKLTIKVQWNNDTSMQIVSPQGQRSLIVTVMPQGN